MKKILVFILIFALSFGIILGCEAEKPLKNGENNEARGEEEMTSILSTDYSPLEEGDKLYLEIEVETDLKEGSILTVEFWETDPNKINLEGIEGAEHIALSEEALYIPEDQQWIKEEDTVKDIRINKEGIGKTKLDITDLPNPGAARKMLYFEPFDQPEHILDIYGKNFEDIKGDQVFKGLRNDTEYKYLEAGQVLKLSGNDFKIANIDIEETFMQYEGEKWEEDKQGENDSSLLYDIFDD